MADTSKGGQPGARNHRWKGGRSVASNGYVIVKVRPGHHLADVRGYAYEHRVVAEANLGRRLRPGEIVHHRNGLKTDNDPKNIEVYPSIAAHRHAHAATGDRRAPGEANPEIDCACGCGARLLRFDGSGRPRRFISGHNFGGRRG